MKITVPDSWNEVTIGQFQEIKGLEDSKEYALQVCSVLLDKDPEEIRKYDSSTVNKILRALEWTMKHPKEDYYKTSIEVDGVEYRMIENLNGFTGGEWWDMEEYLNDFNSNMHYLFAMIYRPKGEYDAVECKKRGELFQEKVMIGDVYGALVFFSLVGQKSIKAIADYSLMQVAKNYKTSEQKKRKSKKGKR